MVIFIKSKKMEGLTKLQKVLLTLLKNSKVCKDNIIGIMITLKNQEEIMEDMALWIYENNPTEEEIMDTFVEIVKKLLQEE